MSRTRTGDIELVAAGAAAYIEYEWQDGEPASYWEPGCGAEAWVTRVFIEGFDAQYPAGVGPEHFPPSWLEEVEQRIIERLNSREYWSDYDED